MDRVNKKNQIAKVNDDEEEEKFDQEESKQNQ
jgi:hypothetical protein